MTARAVSNSPLSGGRSLQPWIGLCSAALFLPLLFPLLTGRVFTRDDFAALHLPFRHLYREALRAGDSFLWTSAYHSGFDLHGMGISGMAHPLHWVLYRFLPLGPAFNLEIVLPFVLMLAGTVLLLQRLGLTNEASWFGAMVFTFSGFNVFNLMHMNHAAIVAHVPWLLLAAHVLLTSPRRRSRALAFAGVAVVVGSELLSGNPQYVWLTAVALAFLTLCLLYAGAPASRVALLAGAGILGVLLGAVQLLPTLDFARESTRMAYSQDEALSFSLSPLNLVQLWSPFAFQFRIHAPEAEALIVHEFIVYNGAFCTMALAWVAMRWRQQTHRGLLVALMAFAAIGLVLAFGRYGGVYTVLAQLPGLRNLRAPARHLVLFQLALSGIAAVAFEDLAGIGRRSEQPTLRRLWPLGIPVVMSVAMTVVAAVLARTSWAPAHGLSFSSLLRAAPWTMLMLVIAGLMVAAARGRRWALPAIVGLVAFDQALWGYSYVYRWGPIQSIAALVASADVPADVRQGELIAPAIVGGSSNVAVIRGVRLTPGYTGLEPSSVLDPHDPLAQRIAGVAWRETGYSWTRVANPMPRARLVSDLRQSADVRADVKGIDVSRVALVDHSIGGVSGPDGSVELVTDRPGFIVADTIAPARQLLVIAERFHAGWRMEEGGVELPPVRVYGDFIGGVVEAGRHRVTFTFAPAAVRQGLRISLASLGLTVALTMAIGRGHWRAASAHRSHASAVHG